MTVSSTNTKNSYSGDGSTTVFAYTFKIFDDDDITVILRTDATGTETVQTKTTHYSVSGVGSAGGGNITFVSAPASGITVVLLRETAQTQTTDYTPNDPFPAADHEDALDKLTLIVQDIQEETDRSLKLSRTNTMTSTEFTVGATDRASKVLAFDTSGELSVTQELGTFRGNWSASTAFAERDLVKDTTNNNIYLANTAHTSSGSLPISSNTDSAKWDLIVDAAAAATSATNAASSATAAASSATAAAASASAAATSETNAAASEAGVAADAAAAAASASSASTSATNAATSETNAATSASSASTSATNAATSATSASNSATSASTSASNAATSETNASNSASAASTSASNAATSETNAATSETNAATSASSAASSASDAATSAAAAEAAFDAFDDIYLGAKASAPTVDNDGDALTAGDQYFNTTNNTLFVYNGSAWQAATPDIVGDTTPQLGGDLDTNGNDITFGDGDKAIFGAGSDLQVYHDGTTASYIETPNVSHSLRVKSDSQLFQTRSGTTWLSGGSGSTVISGGGAATLSVTGTGADLAGDLNFGDNDKAIFGAGSDLQIYHDGSNSYVKDAGAGYLNLLGTGSVVVGHPSNGHIYLNANYGGDVELFFNNSKKLETTSGGINVTGTVTADGLTVDGSATITDTNVRLNLIESDATDLNTRFQSTGGGFYLRTITDDLTGVTSRLKVDHASGDVSLYDSTGSSQGFFWDADQQRLGLGTTSPGFKLTVKDSSSAMAFLDSGGTAVLALDGANGDFSGSDYYQLEADGSSNFNISLAGTPRLTITSGGSVGIGTSSPLFRLESIGSTPAYFGGSSNDGTQVGYASAIPTNSPNCFVGWVPSGVGGVNGDLALCPRTSAGGKILFFTGSPTPTEAARIDSSQNLLVGTTSTTGRTDASSGEGIALSAGSYGGFIGATRDGLNPLALNRLTSDGAIAEFRKDGTVVGSIGVDGDSTNLMIGNGVVGLRFVEVDDQIRPANIDTGGNRDNAIDLGYGSSRFDDIYATNGTIQTSDANEKQDIEALSDAEQRAAVAAKGLLRKFRWKDSVAEKGDDARIHFGIIAQDLKAAFEAEGLDAGRYAMFINTEWTDEETGEQKSRMGIRYNQLLAFIIAAI